MKTYLRYQDEGPSGICGQSCSITCPWDQLHIFLTEKKAEEFQQKVKDYKGRKNARITGVWYDDEEISMYPSVQRHG